MDTSLEERPALAKITGHLAQRLLLIGTNRIELLFLELHEERQRLLAAILLGMAAAAFGLLTGVALTALVAVAFWDHSPLLALMGLALLYSVAGVLIYLRLIRLQRGAQALAGTLDQLRKDRACLERDLV